ncbi:MAG TPA: DUF4234 domain-containing protein [Spirochaetota bacterium]|jgi:hypothetical protein|nr:DUF4234 domain-containing protein [Spirochaetota bacterium]OPZ37189.1 MAG: hypothetical protein BWY96_01837 [Spirochaetes bacterium ADurb.BinA120]HNU90762.1 DUF4234 domain-containing protein [Spirochaetota bacterium]HPI14156.1 DUF4234 domain-containing protein [Spirochaetota bacterium]HPO45020.1 DUF4234 domain-containing protein [Spirochaetota bacterium]
MDERITVRSPAAVIVFSVISCGIYALYWIYRFASELKDFTDRDDINPGLDLLLCILCFPYVVYWSYKYGMVLDEALEKTGQKPDGNAVLYLVLAVFGLFIISMAIMQATANRLQGKRVA